MTDIWEGSFSKRSFSLLRRVFFYILLKQIIVNTNRPMKCAFRIFLKCVNILTRLGRPVHGYSAIVLLFLPFPSLPFICWFGLLAAECFTADFATADVKHLNIAHSFPGSVTVARWGVQSCVSLVGSMVTLTTASVRCENCEFLARPKTQGLFLCELPLFKWISRVCRFIGF